MAITKKDVELNVNTDTVNAYLTSPITGGPGVLVLHAWWGLKPFFRDLCDRLAEAGFVALAPDLNDGQIARTVDEAAALMEKRDFRRTGEIVMAAKDFLRTDPNLTEEKIGVIGFSMGGAWSLVTAAQAPDQIGAAVVFYGSGEVEYGKIRASILGHFSDQDEWEPAEGIKAMEDGMRKANVDVTFHIYPGRKHWFMEADRPEYDPEAARLAWERTLAFLHTNLG
jgi:carboxymethylenebutenolidase